MSTHEQLGLDLKAQGQVDALEAANAWWRSCVDQAITHLAAQGLPFTTDEVRELVTVEPKSPNAWGAVLSAHAKAGRIVHIGFAKSTRPSSHARHVALWIGAE